MKAKQIYQVLKNSLTILLFTLLFFSCKDKCKDIICDNGYCIEGDCFCSDGYSGTYCEIKMSDKFVGKFSGTEKCFIHTIPIDIRISNYSDNPWSINMEFDINNEIDFVLRANVYEDSLFIENQFIEELDPFENDTIINLVYPTKAKLVDDKFLNFDLVLKNVVKTTCKIEVERKFF